MNYNKGIISVLAILCLHASSSYGNSLDSIDYANDAGVELICDVPWVINKDDYIPFFFIIKDCDQYTALEFYCLAIYDISDGVKYYGDEIVPDVDYTDMGYSSPPSFNYNCSIVWSMEIHKVSQF